MRSLLFLALLVSTSSLSHAESCPAGADEISTTPILEQTPTRLAMAKEFALVTGNPDVLVIGDSIAERWKKTQDRDFRSLATVNMGLGGEKTQELRWRLKEKAPQIYPKNIILIIGTNNFHSGKYDRCDVLGGILAVVGDLRAIWPDAKLYVMPLLPMGLNFDFRAADRNFINRALELSASGATVVQVDEYALTCDGGRIGCANYLPDQIHLTSRGYIILRQALKTAGF